MTRGCARPLRWRSTGRGWCRCPRAPPASRPRASFRRRSGPKGSTTTCRTTWPRPSVSWTQAGYVDRQDLGEIVVADVGLGVGPAVEVWRDELGVPDHGREHGVRATTSSPWRRIRRRSSPSTGSPTTRRPTRSTACCCCHGPPATTADGPIRPSCELLQTASAAEGDAAQAAAYREVDAYVDEQAPLIPWSYPTGWWLVRPGLRGLGNLTTGILDFGRVSWGG